MIRNAKILGVALAAALALTAMTAVAASAHVPAKFTSPSGSATLTGAQSGAGDVFTVTAGTTTCEIATYAGSVEGTESSTASAVPTYKECNVKPIGAATITPNGCEYVFHADGTIDIECPGTSEITVVAKVLGITKCTIHIPEQTGLKGATFANKANGDIEVSVSISSGITYSQTAGTGIGACSAAHDSNGSYTGAALVEGSVGGKAADVFWDETVK